MTFTVVYKNDNGRIVKETVDASSRDALFESLEKRGIHPVSVKSGGGDSEDSPAKPAIWKCLLVGVVIVVGVATVWSVLPSQEKMTDGKQEKHDVRTRPADVRPSGEPSKAVAMPPKVENEKPSKRKELPKRPDFLGKIPYEEMTPAQKGQRALYYALASTNRSVVVDRRKDDEKNPPLFNNNVHGYLSQYVEPGVLTLPVGRITDEEARRAIDHKIEYFYDDSVEALDRKKAVEEMLGELKEYMDNGGHAADYFAQLEQRQATESSTLDEARMQVMKLWRDGKEAEAKETLEAFNKYLKGKGMPAVHFGPLTREETLKNRKNRNKKEEDK